MMRIVDMLYSLPFMFFVILLMVYLRPQHRPDLRRDRGGGMAGPWRASCAARRLSLKRKEFIEAARAGGVPIAVSIIRRHIVPNTLGPVVVYVTLTVPQVILLESFLSFLGLGVQEPMTSWGVLISEGAAATSRRRRGCWSSRRRSWP